MYFGALSRAHPEAVDKMADPWKLATLATVHAGEDIQGVDVAFPR